jgi:hypothetical protein
VITDLNNRQISSQPTIRGMAEPFGRMWEMIFRQMKPNTLRSPKAQTDWEELQRYFQAPRLLWREPVTYAVNKAQTSKQQNPVVKERPAFGHTSFDCVSRI